MARTKDEFYAALYKTLDKNMRKAVGTLRILDKMYRDTEREVAAVSELVPQYDHAVTTEEDVAFAARAFAARALLRENEGTIPRETKAILLAVLEEAHHLGHYEYRPGLRAEEVLKQLKSFLLAENPDAEIPEPCWCMREQIRFESAATRRELKEYEEKILRESKDSVAGYPPYTPGQEGTTRSS